MEKKDILNTLGDLKTDAENMKSFKGRAGIVGQIQNTMDFIRSHKLDESLMEKLLKERKGDYASGLKLEGLKYKEK